LCGWNGQGKRGSLHAEVDHGGGNPWNGCHMVLGEEVAQLVEVPPVLQLLIKERGGVVGPVERRVDGYRAPERPLKEVVLAVACISPTLLLCLLVIKSGSQCLQELNMDYCMALLED